MDDGESNATTDYLMEEQCRVEDMPPCDTYQYSEEEDEQNNNTITMPDELYRHVPNLFASSTFCC